jgi:homoserine dehydrogenase
MASLAFDEPLQIDSIYVEGIESITSDDHEWAERLGFSIKHLGIALADDDGIEMRVHPALVPNGSQLASIQDVTNAVNVLADPLGEILLTGAGAGAGPTGSSVVSDLFDLASGCARKPPAALSSVTGRRAAKSIESTTSGWMVRVDVPDESGAMSEVASVLAEYGLSIDQIQQRDSAGGMATVALILDPVQEDQLRSALSNLEGGSNIAGTRAIRVFDPRAIG